MKKLIFAFGILFLAALPALAAEKVAPPVLASDKEKNTPPDPKAAAEALKQGPEDKVMGEANAPITIVEYASLSCPHCAAFAKDVLPKLKEKYINAGQVKYIYRHFPLNAPALKAAMLTECAGAASYYTYIEVLFDSQSKWAYGFDSTPPLKNIAKLGGMSDQEFDSCMANKALSEKIAAGRLKAEKVLKVSSTPTIYIDGVKLEVSHDFPTMSKIIDDDLKKHAK